MSERESTFKPGLVEKIVKMEREFRRSWMKWETAMAEVMPAKRCTCGQELVLLRDCSIAASRRYDRLVTTYDHCWECNTSKSLYWRLRNVGMVPQKLSAKAIKMAQIGPARRRWTTDPTAVAIGFCYSYPNGAYAALSCLEIYDKLTGLHSMDERIASEQPMMLVIGTDAESDSLARWMAREAPLWIVDKHALLRKVCEAWD